MSIEAAPDRVRSRAQVIGYLAFTGILLALGIDIALPAFDEIRPDVGLAAGSSRVTLIITVYFVGMAAGQLIWGPISDRFGRMNTMNAGVALYILGALGSAVSSDLTVMLIVRTVWGVGAAAPAGLRPAIARDLYSGDQMARVMSLVMAIFMIGPILAPLLGEILLTVGSWRLLFVVCAAAAVVQTVWSRQFGETLDPADRQPLDLRTTARSFRRVLATRKTITYTAAYAFSSASFFIFLSSTQPIMDNVYDNAGLLAVVFGVAGLCMAAAFVIANGFIERFGARRTTLTSTSMFITVAAANLVLVMATDGTPRFLLWIVPVVAMNLIATPLGPTCFTLGLEPMGSLAGTAAGVMGFLSIVTAAILAAIVDAQIATTVTPMAVGYLVFGTLTAGALRLAEPRSGQTA